MAHYYHICLTFSTFAMCQVSQRLSCFPKFGSDWVPNTSNLCVALRSWYLLDWYVLFNNYTMLDKLADNKWDEERKLPTHQLEIWKAKQSRGKSTREPVLGSPSHQIALSLTPYARTIYRKENPSYLILANPCPRHRFGDALSVWDRSHAVSSIAFWMICLINTIYRENKKDNVLTTILHESLVTKMGREHLTFFKLHGGVYGQPNSLD